MPDLYRVKDEGVAFAVVQAGPEHRPDDQKEIAPRLRHLVMTVVAQAQERILPRGSSYHDPRCARPVKGSLCQIAFHSGHIHLSFIHGVYLPDPDGRLEGDRLVKRFVKLFTHRHVPWDAPGRLSGAAARLDTYRLSSPPAGAK
jgi:hypothetical protein